MFVCVYVCVVYEINAGSNILDIKFSNKFMASPSTWKQRNMYKTVKKCMSMINKEVGCLSVCIERFLI